MTALTGTRVLELGDVASVEFAGRMLAGLGAEVVKLEPPAGAASRRREPFTDDGTSLAFAADNVGKRSVVVTDDDQVRTLASTADVLVCDLRRAEAAERGLEPTGLRATNPELVVCTVTPFGWSGPWEERLADDLVLMALGGQAAACGYGVRDDDPTPPLVAQGEQAYRTAATFAVMGVLTALFHRDGVGEGQGQVVEISIHECAAATTEWHVMQAVCTGNVMPRFAGIGELTAADGKRVNALNPDFLGDHVFRNLRDLLVEEGVAGEVADPAFEDPAYRAEHGREIRAALKRLAAKHDGEDLFRLGQRVGLPWGVIRTPEETLDDPHLRARGHWQELDGLAHPAAPFVASASPFAFDAPPPRLGEHTDRYLGDDA